MNLHQTVSCHLFHQGYGDAYYNDRTDISYVAENSIHTSRSLQNYIVIADREEEIYEKEFRTAMNKYNAKVIKQGHPERVKNMEDYKTENTYEMIFQIGNMDTLSVDSCSKEDYSYVNDIMQKTAFMMEKEYPQIKITQAIVHWDEACPHMHVRYVGTAYGIMRGMKTQANRKKALEQMGFTGKSEICRMDNATTAFTKDLQKKFIKIAEESGIIREESLRDANIPHLSVKEYKEWMRSKNK